MVRRPECRRAPWRWGQQRSVVRALAAARHAAAKIARPIALSGHVLRLKLVKK